MIDLGAPDFRDTSTKSSWRLVSGSQLYGVVGGI